MVKRLIWIKWGRGKRRVKLETKDYEKVGKVGRLNLYSKKRVKKNVGRRREYPKQRRTKVRKESSKRQYGRKAIKKRVEKTGSVKTEKRTISKKKSIKINQVFEKKVTKKVIKNFLDIAPNEINLQYKSIIKEAMNKKGLGDMFSDEVLSTMIRQENINKIKWRFELRADVFDRDGTKVLQMIKGSGGDLMELKEHMRKGIWRGASVDYDIDTGNGYVFKLINKGNVDRVEVTLIFRS